jgi:hypothetical protein
MFLLINPSLELVVADEFLAVARGGLSSRGSWC